MSAERFALYRYASGANEPVWTGTVDDDTAPIAFIPEMREFGPLMAPGDRLTFERNTWFYAELVERAS